MPVLRPSHVALALLAASSLGCTSAAARARAEQSAPANMPGGVFKRGIWSGQMIGAPPPEIAPMAPMRELAFQVDVSPVRDSAQLTLIFPARAAFNNAYGAGTRPRLRPYDVMLQDDLLVFQLSWAMGWQNVLCRLERNAATSTWDGPCTTREGQKAVAMTLNLPPAVAATNDR